MTSPHNKGIEMFILKAFCRIDNLSLYIQTDKKIRAVVFLIVALFFGIAIYILNVNTPLVIDDFSYSMNAHGERVQGIGDILERQCEHYFLWGGRTVVHIIAQLLLFIPAYVADIVNSIAFLFCAYLMYLHILGRKKKHDVILFALILALMWLLQPAFGESILWLTGSANYVFGMILVLLFMLPYRMYEGAEVREKSSVLKAVLAFPCGVIAGWTNENTAAAMLVMVCLFLLYYKVNKWRIPYWAVVGLIGAIVGYVIMILAPGNHVRSVVIGLEFELTAKNLFSGFFLGTRSFVEYLGVFNLFGLIFLMLNRYFDKEKSAETIMIYLLYMLGVLASIYVMVFSPLFPPRAWFGIVVYNIIAVGLVFNNLKYELRLFRGIKYSVALVVIVLLFPFTYHYAYKDVSAVNEVLQERFRIIENTPDNGDTLHFDLLECETRFGTSDTPFVESTYSNYYKRKIEIR